MDILIGYIKENKWFVLFGAMVWLSMFANFGGNGEYAYILTMVFCAFYCMKNFRTCNIFFVIFPLWQLLSSVVNGVFTYSYFAYILVFLSATPIVSSYRGFVFRGKLLYAILMALPIVTLFNIYAYQTGINYFLLLNYNVSSLNFSGFTQHPMYLGAINGASNVVLTYLLMKARDEKNNLLFGGLLVLLLFSLYLSVVAASRSALGASLICMIGIVFLFSETSGKLVRSGFAIAILASLVMPIMKGGSEQMQMKMDNEEIEGNSREGAWNKRLEEFSGSPIFGIGFSTAYDMEKQEVVTGTVETGSGWLSVLSQAGIVGALIMFFILKGCYVPISVLKDDRGVLVLFMCVFLYFCLHSIFEGYIFTPGYCTCLCFWLLAGVLNEYSVYKNEGDYIQDELGYSPYDDEDDDDDDIDDDDDEYDDSVDGDDMN